MSVPGTTTTPLFNLESSTDEADNTVPALGGPLEGMDAPVEGNNNSARSDDEAPPALPETTTTVARGRPGRRSAPRVTSQSCSFLGGKRTTVAYIVGAVIAVAIATIGTLHLLNVLNFMPAAIPTMAVLGATVGAPALALLTGVALALLHRRYSASV